MATVNHSRSIPGFLEFGRFPLPALPPWYTKFNCNQIDNRNLIGIKKLMFWFNFAANFVAVYRPCFCYNMSISAFETLFTESITEIDSSRGEKKERNEQRQGFLMFPVTHNWDWKPGPMINGSKNSIISWILMNLGDLPGCFVIGGTIFAWDKNKKNSLCLLLSPNV